MASKKVAITIILSIVILASGIGMYWSSKNRNQQLPTEPRSISGQVTELGEGCSSGSTCSITLDNAEIIITGCAVVPNDPHCKDYDQSKLHVGGHIESIVVKSESAGYYNLDCDICTIKIK